MATILWVMDSLEVPLNGILTYRNEKLWFSRNSENEFELHRLPPIILEALEADHKTYCEATGRPQFHGDPHILKKGKAVSFTHTYSPAEISGELIAKISEAEIINLYVPHTMK